MSDGVLLGFQRMSKEPGVYLIVGTFDGQVLYVGRGNPLVGRAAGQYYTCRQGRQGNPLLQAAYDERDGAVEVYLKHTETVDQSRELERQLIRTLKPSCNRQGGKKKEAPDA